MDARRASSVQVPAGPRSATRIRKAPTAAGASAAAARATIPCVVVSWCTGPQGSAGPVYSPREDRAEGLLVVVGLLLARDRGHLDHDRDVLAGGRRSRERDLDGLGLARGDRGER